MGSNAKTGSAAKIKMESFDDLFGGSAAQGNGAEQIINAPLAELHTFKDHPFRVEVDEKMEETTESIRQYGVGRQIDGDDKSRLFFHTTQN